MPRVAFECLYCGNAWEEHVYEATSVDWVQCPTCLETKLLRAKSAADASRGNVFGYPPDLAPPEQKKEAVKPVREEPEGERVAQDAPVDPYDSWMNYPHF